MPDNGDNMDCVDRGNEQRGKIIRNAPPRSQIERLLSQVWSEVLNLDRVEASDNFFDLGGNSIIAIEIVMRARELDLNVSLESIFEDETIAKVAEDVQWLDLGDKT